MKKDHPISKLARRRFVRDVGALSIGTLLGGRWLDSLAETTITLPFENGDRPLVQFPGKRALLQLTGRPPQLETPFSIFDNQILTPNDAFYVRYHSSFILGQSPTGPMSIDSSKFRLNVYGLVSNSLSLSVRDLKTKFASTSLTAVCQCAGNSRGFVTPRVRGGQWGNGAMGNAKWTGVRLSDILGKAVLDPSALRINLNGLDKPAYSLTPDYTKSLDLDVAMNGEVMVAYAMNDKDLPMLNGYPIRLIVPGYYATYWVKHLTDISVVNTPITGFYNETAYRIPDNDCNCVTPGTQPTSTIPLGRMNVRSFITNLDDGAQLAPGTHVVRGIAFDGSGSGIQAVEFSSDGGQFWKRAELGIDFGKYSFRGWKASFTATTPGVYDLRVRAINGANVSQPNEQNWNPSGYLRNVIESIKIMIV